MKLATTTGDFSKFYSDHIMRIKAVRNAGFKYVDFDMCSENRPDSDFFKPDWQDRVKKIGDFAKEQGVEFVQSHAPCGNPLLYDENYDILLQSTIRSIEVCGILGIDNTVVHPGWDGQMDLEEYCKRNMVFFEKLLPYAEKHGVYILIENTTHANMGDIHQNLFTGEDMLAFLKVADHPLVACCWDTGHANCEKKGQYEDILALGDKLKAIHFNDNRGQQDEHLIPFAGTLCVDDVMGGLMDAGYKGCFTFECSSTLRPAKYWLGNRNAFSDVQRLINPTVEMQNKLEELLYMSGRYILEEYGCLEE